jgi:hypothetical protein
MPAQARPDPAGDRLRPGIADVKGDCDGLQVNNPTWVTKGKQSDPGKGIHGEMPLQGWATEFGLTATRSRMSR